MFHRIKIEEKRSKVDLFTGSKSRITLTDSNTVPKVITEPNKDPGTFPVLSTSTSAVTIRPVSHVEEKNTKSYDVSLAWEFVMQFHISNV